MLIQIITSWNKLETKTKILEVSIEYTNGPQIETIGAGWIGIERIWPG